MEKIQNRWLSHETSEIRQKYFRATDVSERLCLSKWAALKPQWVKRKLTFLATVSNTTQKVTFSQKQRSSPPPCWVLQHRLQYCFPSAYCVTDLISHHTLMDTLFRLQERTQQYKGAGLKPPNLSFESSSTSYKQPLRNIINLLNSGLIPNKSSFFNNYILLKGHCWAPDQRFLFFFPVLGRVNVRKMLVLVWFKNSTFCPLFRCFYVKHPPFSVNMHDL